MKTVFCKVFFSTLPELEAVQNAVAKDNDIDFLRRVLYYENSFPRLFSLTRLEDRAVRLLAACRDAQPKVGRLLPPSMVLHYPSVPAGGKPFRDGTGVCMFLSEIALVTKLDDYCTCLIASVTRSSRLASSFHWLLSVCWSQPSAVCEIDGCTREVVMSDQATALQSGKLRRSKRRRDVPKQPTAEAFAVNSRQRFREP